MRDVVTLEPQRSVDGARRLSRVEWSPTKATCICRGTAARVAIADAIDRGSLAASAELLGLAQRMLDMTVDYVKMREQFGKPIGSFQAVKHHLADALGAIELARPIVYRAAWSMATSAHDSATHVSMAKAFASDAALLVAKKALQCHGAIGYSYEHDLHLWMKRAWALAAAWGDAASHRARVGSALFHESRAKREATP
jgi:alkylation response protein AidB-like acyl-CoA dehydrogenase